MDYDKIDIDATIREGFKNVDATDIGKDLTVKTVVIGHGSRKVPDVIKVFDTVIKSYERLEKPLKDTADEIAKASIVCLVCDSTMKQIVKACEFAEIEMVKNRMILDEYDIEFKSIGNLMPIDNDVERMRSIIEDIKFPEAKTELIVKGCPSDFNQKSNRPKWLNRR